MMLTLNLKVSAMKKKVLAAFVVFALVWCAAAFGQEPPVKGTPGSETGVSVKAQVWEWKPTDPREQTLKKEVDDLLEQVEGGRFDKRKEATHRLRLLIRKSEGVEDTLAKYIGKRLENAATFEVRYRLRKVLDYYLRPWNCIEMKRSLNEHVSYVMSVVFSPDGKMLASCGGNNDSTVKVWDPAAGACLHTLEGHEGAVYCLAFSPDGKMLASAGQDGTVRIWDPQSGECSRKFENHAGNVYSVAFSPDGKWMASAGADHTLKTWNVKTGKCVHILSHTSSFHSTTFSPDSKLLASASEDGNVRLWDLGNGKCVKTLEGHSGSASCVAFSADGKLLASAGGDNTVRVWDVQTGKCTQKIEGGNNMRIITFSPDGAMLASAESGGRIRILDPRSGEVLRTLTGHFNHVYSVAFSPDGSTLASGGYDTTIVLWTIPKVSGGCRPEHKAGESEDESKPEGGQDKKKNK